ncbi:threonyl-tRNA synthetase [Catovirus CTV1]|uniref:Threonyl-tRNA synthetase n=1 Tax=Catovirus CTV1 TaxID=1977631 RepID=A0A1V0SBD4_9VIRU|nr:threonyl-tRNA synthetase [Catovirus CTV1]
MNQCATIQLDFNLPERFQLEYVKEDQSFERFIAILCEQLNGKWPFWLSPNQIKIIPINSRNNNIPKNITNILRDNKYSVELDDSDNTLNKKILNAQKDQFYYMIVIGDKEEKENKLNIRYRENNEKKFITLNELLQELDYKANNYL